MGMLSHGDNLDILRRYLKDETAAPAALAPPFNSAQNGIKRWNLNSALS